ncbi:peptidase M16 [Amylibacter marinus]|uniref:Peptidase M16 n=1 Tax=Amylibacter marinus TaxID=1475483 RepID=A0ABQ5VWE6_9RHOB|nr:pitrilysin family protein [Amylibacter marinus]GLQ35768.1 peptidase M16 [Amylibacter marinus]
MIRIISAVCAFISLALPAVAEIDIEEVVSPGGITAWLVSEPSIPMVSIEIGFKGGSLTEPDDKLGSTYLMAGLLEEGAGDLDSVAFRQAAEALASSFSFDSSKENVLTGAQFLKENMDASIDLWKLALTQPSFDDTAFERTKAQVQSIVARRAKTPNEIAGDAFSAVAYAGHPYARTYQGTLKTIGALTQQDMRDAHRRSMTKDRMFIGVVGDITAAELGPVLDHLLGDLPETGPTMPNEITFQAEGGVTVVDFNTPQSVAVWGHQGIAQDDPDFFPAFVMNHIMGGSGFTSRLTSEVREKRGLTYGIYSYLASMDFAQYYGGSVSSSNDSIGEAIEIVKAEWARMAAEGVSAAELDAAKKYMTGNYPLRFDGNAKIAGLLRYSQMDNFPIDYPKKRNGYINAVTQEDIKRVAARLMRADDLHFVVVGKPVGLTSAN